MFGRLANQLFGELGLIEETKTREPTHNTGKLCDHLAARRQDLIIHLIHRTVSFRHGCLVTDYHNSCALNLYPFLFYKIYRAIASISHEQPFF